MSVKIPVLKQLTFENVNSELFISLDHFWNFLKNENVKSSKHNVARELDRYKGKEATSALYSLEHILIYSFHHSHQFEICRTITRQACAILSGREVIQNSIPSSLELYKDIAKYAMKHDLLEINLYPTLDIQEETLEHLQSYHKSLFSDLVWKRICLFEHHFQNECETEQMDLEEVIKNKSTFWQQIKTIKDVTSSFASVSRKTIVRRKSRHISWECEKGIKIWTDKAHNPLIIEDQLYKHITCIYGDEIQRVVCVDCSEVCQHTRGIHVHIDLVSADCTVMEDIAGSARRLLANKHGSTCPSVMFWEPDSISSYKDNDDNISRFQLRDDVTYGRHGDNIILNSVAREDTAEPMEDECTSCINDTLLQPLHWDCFNLVQEWNIDVPLPIQIVLESFINKTSIKRSKSMKSILESKLEALYATYDRLLNVYNKNHAGVLQQRNTTELTMHYKSVNTVFSVTSDSGATISLSEAEKRLKASSHQDLCYYNTYIRRFPMAYTSVGGSTENDVSLRECLLILMMDNLVRLRYHRDPDPGQNRSQQICTLPITVKGLPRDHALLQTWHDPDICDGEVTCSCMRQQVLSKEDGRKSIFEISKNEEAAFTKFEKLCNWTIIQSWCRIETTKSLSSFMTWGQENEPEEDVSILQSSFMSLDISDEDPDVDTFSDTETQMESPIHPVASTSASGQPTVESLLNQDDESDSDDDIEEDPDLLQLLCRCTDDENIADDFNFVSLDNAADSEDEKAEYERLGVNEEPSHNVKDLLHGFGFSTFKPPTLLCRHPPPAYGRDDDPVRLKEILDDFIMKTGNYGKDATHGPRILFAPDHKIGKNLLRLLQQPRYRIFLPEFPLLHLRKSKMTNLFSGYKNAGMLQFIQYMKDDSTKEWGKLITEENIEAATRNVWRISMALHLSFLVTFLRSLPNTEATKLCQSWSDGIATNASAENESFQKFLEVGQKNATFALHVDMMKHCDEVLAVALSERLGGKEGYQLLLHAVKSSLPFAFLNGAAAYAAYTTCLLQHHFEAGYFHKCMKMTLYSTPHKDSSVNFALDAQREMDHRDVIRAFRTGGSMTSILPRMALIDTFNEAHDGRQDQKSEGAKMEWQVTDTDLKYMTMLAELILRRGALTTNPCDVPYNVYSKLPKPLPIAILDQNTEVAGKHLISKYLCQQGIFGHQSSDLPSLESTAGPKNLIDRVQKTKGVTINRTKLKTDKLQKSEQDVQEEKRMGKLKTLQKKVTLLSSNMNACQALVQHDCSKPKVAKAKGISCAVRSLLKLCHDNVDINHIKSLPKCDAATDGILAEKGIVWLQQGSLPELVAKSVTYATSEFAGVKFKTKAGCGKDYITSTVKNLITYYKRQLPRLRHLVICEEKYSFTPDVLKAATRKQRTAKSEDVKHLKLEERILSTDQFDKVAIISTSAGKSTMSTFLAEHIDELPIREDLVIDIDSEYAVNECSCSGDQMSKCSCKKYTVPLRCNFSKADGLCKTTLVTDIHQTKGEAEMSQVDWLMTDLSSLQAGEAAVSFVTSGDIDAVVIHLFAVSYKAQRNEDGSFVNDIYIVLQKPGNTNDIYNITKIINVLESHFEDVEVARKIAIILCLGGNDFLPKFHAKSHSTVLFMYLRHSQLWERMLTFDSGDITLDTEIYKEFVKYLYCPKRLNPSKLAFDDVRNLTIQPKTKNNLKDPRSWLPPASVLERIASLLTYQVKYLLTAGTHDAPLPDFLESGCLVKNSKGEIEYDFGPEAFCGQVQTTVEKFQSEVDPQERRQGRKRHQAETPQKGMRRKFLTSTPRNQQAVKRTEDNT